MRISTTVSHADWAPFNRLSSWVSLLQSLLALFQLPKVRVLDSRERQTWTPRPMMALFSITALVAMMGRYYHRGPLNDRRIMEGNIRDGNIIKTADECSPLACVRRLSALLLQLFNLYFWYLILLFHLIVSTCQLPYLWFSGMYVSLSVSSCRAISERW